MLWNYQILIFQNDSEDKVNPFQVSKHRAQESVTKPLIIYWLHDNDKMKNHVQGNASHLRYIKTQIAAVTSIQISDCMWNSLHKVIE